jgi:hypothetical protein
MRRTVLPAARHVYAECALAAASFAVCAALMTAAAVAHAPAGVIPLAVLVCIGCPMAMSWRLPSAIAMLRAMRMHPHADHHALATLRSQLSRLPETDHPLGL